MKKKQTSGCIIFYVNNILFSKNASFVNYLIHNMYTSFVFNNCSDPIQLGPGQIMPRGYGMSSGKFSHFSDMCNELHFKNHPFYVCH